MSESDGDDQARPQFENLRTETDDRRETLRSIQIPLEIISNLSFLTAHSLDNPAQAKKYLESLDQQVSQIATQIRDFLRPRTIQ